MPASTFATWNIPTDKGWGWPEEISCLTPGSDHIRTIESDGTTSKNERLWLLPLINAREKRVLLRRPAKQPKGELCSLKDKQILLERGLKELLSFAGRH